MAGPVLFWLRRDLRLHDNHGLYQALTYAHAHDTNVQLVFLFDREILDALPRRDDRVLFLHQELEALNQRIWADHESGIRVAYGKPLEIWPKWLAELQPTAVFTNRDYEPYAITRDEAIHDLCQDAGVPFETFQDHVLFERDNILTQQGKMYSVFTPYKNRWLEATNGETYRHYPSEDHLTELTHQPERLALPTLQEMNFETGAPSFPARQVEDAIIRDYEANRNYPALDATSRLGLHLRHGTVSVRRLADRARELSSTFLNELIWRDFYSQVLWHSPNVVTQAFKPDYDKVPWREDEEGFARWCAGETGYPMVDAGMRQLNTEGYMHNRVRMITASFLTKHLLIDWRRGEHYFAEKLLDFELASNNGGWQWAAGSGTDSQPYFRIFNPTSQEDKFDPQKQYIRKYVPEFGSGRYTAPIVDHKAARQRCLDVYKAALKGD